MSQLDILCFGAHPDDVEIGMSGTIIKHVQEGLSVGICDLTLAELSSNGTVEIRQKEAAVAGQVLGIKERFNLKFPDRGLQINADFIGPIVHLIRTYRPAVVCAPFDEDRHPDHNIASRLIEEAVFTANIRKFQWGEQSTQPHAVKQLYFYLINQVKKPHLLVDTTPHFEQKKKALLAYESQFNPGDNGVQTRLTADFIDVVEGRDRLFGKMVNVRYAEGFMTREPLLIPILKLDSESRT